jgi:hypothetical protein
VKILPSFAGEGGPERTNKRFHYVSLGMPAKRLSTALRQCDLIWCNDQDYVLIFTVKQVMRECVFAVWTMLRNYILI